MQCILYKIYFWKVFHMYYNFICIFICTPIWTKKIILVKSGCYTEPSYLSFFFFSLFWIAVIYLHTDIYIYIRKLVPLHPYIPGSPTAMSRGPGTQVRHTTPPRRGRPPQTVLTMSFLGKGVTSLLPESSPSSLSRVRDPEVMKLFIMS
jgi:hypothetical protein